MANIYHYMGKRLLQDWIHVEIENRGATKYVTFVSRLHVNTRYTVPWTYSKNFSDAEILSDGHLVKRLIEKYGPDVFKDDPT